MAVGFPMVIFESLLASWSFGRKPEMRLLTPLSRFILIFLGIYLAAKVSDLMIREAYVNLFDGSVASYAFVAELGLGVILPFALLLSDRVRRSPVGLLLASTLVVGGVALNRVNVFLVAYNPPFATTRYFPSLSEIFITVGLVAGLVFMYRTLVMLFPILPAEEESQAYETVTSREPLQVRTDPYALS